MLQMSDDMRRCIDVCTECHQTCLGEAMRHCLEAGGSHVEPAHFRLMIACAEMCRTSAHFMLSGVDLHRRTCAVCAEVCEACSASCADVGEMGACVDVCRRCAESCRRMAA
ncbi:MAG: four-helix bundle copper-binding protein [Alphaproteobacteria bacterium]